jgi:hypothetical protein
MFKIFTIGWEPAFAHALLEPIAKRTGIEFSHGLVGDARRLGIAQGDFPDSTWLALSKPRGERLPAPDVDLLASLESVGIPTVRTMIRGDRVLRHRDPEEALGYATLLAREIIAAVSKEQPSLVLGNFDSLHSAIGLAVAKSRGIPWVALAFSVIPDNLTWFCKGMTPETLVPFERDADERLLTEAREVMLRYRAKAVKIIAYQPPVSARERAQETLQLARNLGRRFTSSLALGVDHFTFPTIHERMSEVGRRFKNRLRFPGEKMLMTPPAGRFVFFPLHMAPESSVDTWAPMYQNQLELASQLSLAVPADMEVVVKLHFSDPDNYSADRLNALLHLPHVRIAHPRAPARAFIENASLVIGIQGTASLEAALLGKPVLLFGDSPYQHFPRSERAQRPDELHAQILRMIERAPPTDDEIVRAFAAYIARYRPGRINDWKLALRDEDLDRLADCFRALKQYVEIPGNREAWYETPPFAASEQRPHQRVIRKID